MHTYITKSEPTPPLSSLSSMRKRALICAARSASVVKCTSLSRSGSRTWNSRRVDMRLFACCSLNSWPIMVWNDITIYVYSCAFDTCVGKCVDTWACLFAFMSICCIRIPMHIRNEYSMHIICRSRKIRSRTVVVLSRYS